MAKAKFERNKPHCNLSLIHISEPTRPERISYAVFFKFGGVVEWLKAADCKSARVSVRRFESYPLHQYEGMEKVSECVSYKAGVA